MLDIDLPLINGFRVCRLIKNTPATRHIPVVLISAYFHDAAHAERAREVGADGFVLKPFDPESLLHIARRLLG